MPQTIQRPPHGLLALLDSKAGGQNPWQLDDNVSPSIDLRDLYEVRARRSTNTTAITGATIAAGVGTFIQGAATLAQPPNDALWHVRNISLRASAVLGAADVLYLGLGWQDVRNSSLAIVGVTPRFTNLQAPVWGVDCDVFIGPGQILGIWVIEAATPDDIVLQTTFDLYQPV